MKPTPEQIEAARAFCERDYLKKWSRLDRETQFLISLTTAAYAAHCVAEATAEKDAEIARLKEALKPFVFVAKQETTPPRVIIPSVDFSTSTEIKDEIDRMETARKEGAANAKNIIVGQETKPCPRCNGAGYYRGLGGLQDCHECGGKG